MKSIDVICPVFEESEVLPVFNTVLRAKLDSIRDKYTSRILYICDPGRDNTESVLIDLCQEDSRVGYVILSRRFGHQLSLLAGIDHSDADIIIMMDCDLQHPPEVISRLLEEYENGVDIVHTIRKYSTDEGVIKRTLSSYYYRILSSVSETRILANAADFRLISKRVALLFKTELRERNLFLRGLFTWVGFQQGYVKFDAPIRKIGASKYTISRIITFAVAGVVSFSKRPLRISIYLGLISAAAGIALGATTIIQYITGAKYPTGWASMITVSSFLGGAQLLCIGVLGEYIGYIFDESKGRPLYIVDKKLISIKK